MPFTYEECIFEIQQVKPVYFNHGWTNQLITVILNVITKKTVSYVYHSVDVIAMVYNDYICAIHCTYVTSNLGNKINTRTQCHPVNS